jgi:hypothetical protein
MKKLHTHFWLLSICYTLNMASASGAMCLNSSDKSQQLVKFDHSPGEYCQRQMLMRFINAQSGNETLRCDEMSISNLEKFADEEVARVGTFWNPWSFSLVPTANSLRRLNEKSNSLKFSLTQSSPPNSEKLKEILQKFRRGLSKESEGYRKNASSFQMGVLCAELASKTSQECVRGAQVILETMIPRGSGMQISNVPAWEKVIGTDAYQTGLKMAGLKVLERLAGALPSEANIYDDIRLSFLDSGLSSEDSIEATYQTLAVIASGGANVGLRMQHLGIFDNTTGYALTAMSLAMNELDYIKHKNGQPLYSYPAQVKATCLYSKPYHFWMSAAISRELVKNHRIDPASAAAAAFTAQKGYQMSRDLTGGSSTNGGMDSSGGGGGSVSAVFKKPAFDPVHEVIRMDLAFSAVGAQMGSESVYMSSSNLDVDKALRILIAKASALNPSQWTSSGIVGQYKNWNQLFEPNKAFFEAERQVGRSADMLTEMAP